MKKILIFIGLKLAEILGVCGIAATLYGLGMFTDSFLFPGFHISILRTFFSGFIGLIAIVVIIGICLCIYHAIKANWNWADRIAKWK
jgi:hypothetical protein